MITNKLRLPQPIVDAIMNDSYSKGDADISVTEMLTPPQLVRLRRQHRDEIVEDASDRIWSLLGQAVHTIIERAGLGSLTELTEITLHSEYGGWKIKGTIDHVTLINAELADFKVTTAWKIRAEGPPIEWVQQTNIYRRMLQKEKGITINSIAVIAILRDWSRNEAARRPDYPQAQVVRLEIPLWTAEEADAFILERVRLHQMEIPVPCTDADIWAKPTRWAVVKKGQVRAVKLFDGAEEARDFAITIPGSRVDLRPGEATRCLSWCPVSKWCGQWQADPRRPELALQLFSE